MAGGEGSIIGLVMAHEDRELGDALAEALPDALRDGGAGWRAEVLATEPADASASASEMIEAVRRSMLDRGWTMGLGLTELPLRDGRRPVATHVSASHRVGLISIPALGAVRRDDKLRQVAADVAGGLLAGHRGDKLPAHAHTHGTVRFTRLAILANLQLLTGMILANRPTRVMAGLSRSAVAALGTGAYAVSSASMWNLAHDSSWLRLLGIGVVSSVLVVVAMVVAHGLWERADDPAARERVVLFNVVTITTLAIGVVALYLALFVITALAAGVMIPPESLQREIGKPPGVLDYAQVAWLAASVATVGGALGSLIESDETIRDATYRPAPRRS